MSKSNNARGMLITAVIAVAVGVAGYSVIRNDPDATGGSGLPDAFTLDLDNLLEIDPALISYEQSARIDLPLKEVHAIAAGPEQRIYVGGDNVVRIMQADGTLQSTIELDGSPTALAVAAEDHADPGRIYVALGRRIALFNPDGSSAGVWDPFDEKTQLTSLALAKSDLFAADAGNRVVHRCDLTGKLIATVGAADSDPDMPGFRVPSPYFDVAVDSAEMFYVANPGALRIEAYSFDGHLQTFWGKAGSSIERFFGCCNPSHFALLPDGRFVTSEKGLPRIKVYSEHGEFQSAIAGPSQLEIAKHAIGDPRSGNGAIAFDVAVDSAGRVLVLDDRKNCVRVFTELNQSAATTASTKDGP